jgi:hypothetical protein
MMFSLPMNSLQNQFQILTGSIQFQAALFKTKSSIKKPRLSTSGQGCSPKNAKIGASQTG